MNRTGVVVALGACLSACASDLPGEVAPTDTLYFPIGVVAAPVDDRVYIVNTNFDLRFNSGWVSVLSVDGLLARLAGAATNPFVQRLLVPSQGGRLALHPDGDVGVLPARGDGVVAGITVAADGTLACGDAANDENLRTVLARTDCDAAHLVVLDDAMVEADKLFDEDVTDTELRDPFAATMLTYDSVRYAAVGYLGGPRISLFATDASAQVDHVRAFSFGKGATASLAVYPDATRALLVATSQLAASDSPQSRLLEFDVARSFAEGEGVTSQASVSSVAGGRELMDLVFSSDGTRLVATNHTPDALLLLDTSLTTVQQREDNGTYTSLVRPRYDLLAALPLPGRPSGIAMLSDELVAVTSLQEDAVFVVRIANDALQLVRRFDDVGAGPFQAAVVQRDTRTLLIVTTFFDHGVAVFDVTGADAQAYSYLGALRSATINPAER